MRLYFFSTKERKQEAERQAKGEVGEGLGVEFLLRLEKETFPSNKSVRKKCSLHKDCQFTRAGTDQNSQ